jgi:hypothetical protein
MIPESEMREFMGTAYVPGTFPTVGVYKLMVLSGVKSSWSEVDRLWDAYFLATTVDGIAPYSKAASGAVKSALINALVKKTSLSKMTVVAFLNALEDEVNAGGGSYYLDPKGSQDASKGSFDLFHPLESLKTVTKGVGDAIGAGLKPVTDPVTNIVKYAAIGLVSVAVIYGIFQGMQFLKKSKRRK